MHSKIIIDEICDICGLDRNLIRTEQYFNDLGISSFDIVRIIISLEDKFDVHLENTDFDLSKLQKVQDMINAFS
ncbi:phosphopantetheine-binding protein [Photobacterium damselae]|uniref:phosphopantetheine-binding protein n=1 Tax=Photobacterium damselae TaxID=38293 RepID=UPI001EFE2C76|nr:phosphopantetheine-binding protein [Photobacterium damselae]MCG9780669.1 phosphopantetheine-binding protein [Photobacterium damselae]